MVWIAPSEKDPVNRTLERKLWDAGDEFRANSGLVTKCEVQSANSEVQTVRHSKSAIRHLHQLSIHGVEKTDETGRLCRMNIAIRSIEIDFGPEHINTFCRHLLPELRIPQSWRV